MKPAPATSSRVRAADRGTITIGGRAVAYTVTRSRRRRRTVAMRLDGATGLCILAPMSASTGFLMRFMESKAAWIARALDARADQVARPVLGDGGTVPYLGHACTVAIVRTGRTGCRLTPRRWHVGLPDAVAGPDMIANEVRLELRLWFKRRARIVMQRRLDLWARRMGLRYTGFRLTDAERRWGSCSAQDIIRLNWRLMLAPLPVLDYVIVHELAHIPHKDHSARFWACVGRALPDYEARRQRLRGLEHALSL